MCHPKHLRPAAAVMLLAWFGAASASGIADYIDCSQFKRNPDGTWTSGAAAKIVTYTHTIPFAGITFGKRDIVINGEDIADVLEAKCPSK
jgi:hypothetical protein